jgi:hypothetical protein
MYGRWLLKEMTIELEVQHDSTSFPIFRNPVNSRLPFWARSMLQGGQVTARLAVVDHTSLHDLYELCLAYTGCTFTPASLYERIDNG